MRFWVVVFLALTTGMLYSAEPDRVELHREVDTLESRLVVQAVDGEIALADVFRAVSRFHGYDDGELQSALPGGAIALHGRAAGCTISTLNRILKPCVHITPRSDSLEITIDRTSARQWVNRRKESVRWAWQQIDWRRDPPNYGIEFSSPPGDGPLRDIVVLVHGLNSRPEDVAGFVATIERAGHVAAAFRYPNDQPIDESSRLLSRELLEFSQTYPDRRIRLLTHSMGGLVARGAVETDMDPGNVVQLIMIAPPNHGSSLAPLATFMDCYEFCTSTARRRSGVLVESVADGLGEATADLAPGSVLLDSLNRRPRNPNIHYTILLGTAGAMSSEEMESLRTTVREYSDGNRYVRFVTSKLNRSLAGLDEVVSGKGDGVVSCQRGKLAGVADIVELPFSHAGVLGQQTSAAREAHGVVLSRLRKF